MEEGANVGSPVEIVGHSELMTCNFPKKLFRKVVTVVDEDVVAVGQVSLAHPRDQHMVDLKLGHLEHDCLRVLPIEDRNGVLEDKRAILPRARQVNAAFMRIDIASEGELVFADLDGCVVGSETNLADAKVAPLHIWQVVDVDKDGGVSLADRFGCSPRTLDRLDHTVSLIIIFT